MCVCVGLTVNKSNSQVLSSILHLLLSLTHSYTYIELSLRSVAQLTDDDDDEEMQKEHFISIEVYVVLTSKYLSLYIYI